MSDLPGPGDRETWGGATPCDDYDDPGYDPKKDGDALRERVMDEMEERRRR